MNFLHRFIPILAIHLIEMTNMLKMDNDLKWSQEACKSFHVVKLALTTALVLISPNYSNDFNIFSFSFEPTMATILM